MAADKNCIPINARDEIHFSKSAERIKSKNICVSFERLFKAQGS